MTAAGADADSVAVGELFALMLCEDSELLEAEFEAIMTANGFDAEPPAPSRPEQRRAGRGNGPVLVLRGHVRRAQASALAGHVPGRQRSPP
jgi:hypothetical protein